MPKSRIRILQKQSRSLEPNKEQRAELMERSLNYGEKFMDSLSDQKAYQTFDHDHVHQLLEDPLREEPSELNTVIEAIQQDIVPPGLNPASGAHFGYIPGGGIFSSAVGDYLSALTNRYVGVYFSSPGAVVLETRLVNWMAGLIGFDKKAGGFLSSGGSIANLTAVVTAREHAGLHSSDYSKAVVYLTKQTHHCVDKALNISGMGDCVKRYIPMDDHFKMDVHELKKSIQKDREEKLIPWMIIASAGTTDTGAIDRLDEIGESAKEQHLWYHIDAAYGGFFLLTKEGKQKLKGIDRADSVVLDPHKGLFLPYGTGALVVKNAEILANAHHYEANYMQDTKVEAGMYSPAEISPELSKHFRGLRMWMPLKLHGVQAFRSALEEKLLLTQYAWERLSEMEDIEVGPEPELTVFTFRWAPKINADLDKLNQKLHQAMIEDGRVFLSTTRIEGEFRFRFAVLSVRSHLEEIELFFSVLKEKIDQIG
ncbi:pyridoxal phosphate-dependent decarboxylase family protein [Gracilimonas tropica]|uniref:pyridoxal phosphate-dependent decarboxylase family protein n=1 Tax=Gracilimonas tropica TaxID=454600 RepID=UPI00037D3EFD|nr:aminotransferase class I/II-fold pyridoxal phosphate-dependent enzyme [Gracilimonas tropica]